MLYGHVSGNDPEVAIELSIFFSFFFFFFFFFFFSELQYEDCERQGKPINPNFLPLILFIFKLINFNPPREFV